MFKIGDKVRAKPGHYEGHPDKSPYNLPRGEGFVSEWYGPQSMVVDYNGKNSPPVNPDCFVLAEPVLVNAMTMRDYLAANAPIDYRTVCLAWGGTEEALGHDGTRAGFMAVWSLLRYEYADAMLAERDK